MLACLLVPLPGLDPCAPASSVDRDPHLHFAHGGRADFRGEHGRTYSFLSAPGLAVNIKTEDAVFRMNGGRLVVHGSFITEAHVVARAAGSNFAFVNASFPGSSMVAWCTPAYRIASLMSAFCSTT